MNRMKHALALVVALLAGSASNAVEACRDLGERYVDITLSQSMPIDAIARRILSGSGWRLAFREPGEGVAVPEVKGALVGRADRVLTSLVRSIRTAGYIGHLALADCTANLAVSVYDEVLDTAAGPVDVRLGTTGQQADDSSGSATDHGAATYAIPPMQPTAMAAAADGGSVAGGGDLAEPAKAWVLRRNALFDEEIKRWGKEAGWRVVWKPATLRWRVFETARFEGAFLDVVRRVVNIVRDQGRLLSMTAYQGNRVLILELSSGEL